MRNLLRIAAIVYGAYLAIALLILSPALNVLPHKYLKDTYGRELHTGWVLFNPFKVSLDISDAELLDDTGEPFVAFSNASINLSMESLWQPGWVLDAVTVRDLFVDVTRLDEDEFNYSDLLPEESPETPPESGNETAIPGITIHELALHSETIAYNDRTRKTPFTSRWNGLDIRVTRLSTVFEEGRPFKVEAEVEGGGTLHWEGEISIPDGSSSGHLALTNLNLRNVWLFARPWLQLELKKGQLTVAADYQVNWQDQLQYSVSEGHIGLSDIDIVPLAPDALADTAVSIAALDISDLNLDGQKKTVTIGMVALDDLALETWLENSTVSLQQLFAVNFPQDATDSEQDSDDADWSVVLDKAQLRNASLDWRSAFTEPQTLQIKPIDASVEHLTWPLSGATLLSLSLGANDQAKITLAGSLALDPGNGSIDYQLDGLPLAWFDPNLPDALKATITGGEVAVKGQVKLVEFAPSTIALDGKIRGFSARTDEAETQLTGWDTVRIKGLAIDMEQHSLLLQKLSIDGYTGRLHIHEDGSINASNIWKEEVGDDAQKMADDLTEDKPWRFSIPAIVISDSEIDFMDASLPITFRTVVGDLEGEVNNITSAEGESASVDIKGSVDGYAPVSLTGKVAPFAATPDLNLNLTFDGVDMALLSPYSGTYAGYAIDRGLLDLHLNYLLKDNHLKGHNEIRIEKLKLGKKIASAKAIDLPLNLALAILTDSKGVIDMAIPVSGDVDNPGFALGSVISKAFLNILTKAITAPFTLLASLVDTEDDLQRLTFSSGSAVLKETNQKKLQELATALTQRPKLSLVITGRLNLSGDRGRLQRNVLKGQLLERGLTEEAIKTKGPNWEEAIAERYSALHSGAPDAAPPSSHEQYVKVVQSIPIADTQMTELADERAVAVKRYLVTEAGLAPERAVVGQSSLDQEANDFSGAELGIGT